MDDLPEPRCFSIDMRNLDPLIDPDQLPCARGGRFRGPTPMQAAKKAFTQLCRASNVDPDTQDISFDFILIDKTEGSANNRFRFRGSRRRLAEPQTISKGGQTFEIRYQNQVTVL